MGKLLACSLREQQVQNSIFRIQAPNGNWLVEDEAVRQAFQTYYKKLYESVGPATEAEINTYLAKVFLPTLTDSEIKNLEHPINGREIQKAIQRLANDKASGLDGYTAKFYKTFTMFLIGPLLELFKGLSTEFPVPPSMRPAGINILLKPRKEASSCSSYHPISLLNIDVKFWASILAC